MELLLLSKTTSPTDHTLSLSGKHWAVTGPYDHNHADKIPKFACVSYVWGAGRVPHPFIPQVNMSTNTMPSLDAAIRASRDDIEAYWIDIFCVPWTQPSRGATLESMGLIYSAADRVIAILGPDCTAAFDELARRDWIEDEFLQCLEDDEWVRSVWTYQEIVNNPETLITTANRDSGMLSGEDFLNRIGFTLYRHKKAHNLTSPALRRRWPRLDALEDLGLDGMLWAPFERPVLQVMSMLDRRTALNPQNKCYSMIGALTQAPTTRRAGESLADLRKKVLNICEEKGDFSFVYSSTPRDSDTTDNAWAPSTMYDLRSILPFSIAGRLQNGHRDSQGQVWLHDVVILQPITLQAALDLPKILCDLLESLPLSVKTERDEVAEIALEGALNQVAEALNEFGFTGVTKPLFTRTGVFYPQTAVAQSPDLKLLMSAELSWTFGHPGLCIADGQIIPGAYIGRIDKKSSVQYCLGSSI